jgi:hypothetical protein
MVQADAYTRRAKRLIVISDLHLGGDAPFMMSHPDALAAFIEGLPARAAADEDLELIIAGDFVDFLATSPYASWTPDPLAARGKLDAVTSRPGGGRRAGKLRRARSSPPSLPSASLDIWTA